MSAEIERLEAVAAVVSHAGRVRWLRPELCEVGDQLCRLTEAQSIIAQRDARIAELEAENERFVEALEVAAGKAINDRENLRAELAALKALLSDAAEDLESWGAYASEYFQEKHDLAGCVVRYRRAAVGDQEDGGEEIAAIAAMPLKAQQHSAGVVLPDSIVEALKFYADGDHLLLADPDAWDTCSGEPMNFLHDEAGTASVEDGSIAKAALARLNQPTASAGVVDERAEQRAAIDIEFPELPYDADQRDIDRQRDRRYYFARGWQARARLNPKPAGSGVVLPERADENEGNSYSVMQAMARNQTIDEVARLNPCRAQSVPDGIHDQHRKAMKLLREVRSWIVPKGNISMSIIERVGAFLDSAAAPSAKKES